MTGTLACLHHLEQPFLGLAERPLRDAGLVLDERALANGDALPELDQVDGILSFGGSQSARDLDAEPVLRAEAELLSEAVAQGMPVLGMCLGGQVLARSLGAEVRRLPRRTVAWLELTATEGARDDPLAAALGSPVAALHWNEDFFDLPAGATELLTRAGPGVTAFRAGDSAWGVQFHPEVDATALDGWYSAYGEWLEPAGVTEREARAADAANLPGQLGRAERLFGAFAQVVAGASGRHGQRREQ